MKKDVIAFYGEALKMGEILTHLFKHGHPCHPLANFMVTEPIPLHYNEAVKIDYICNHLMIPVEELERLLSLMKKVITLGITGNENPRSFKGAISIPMNGIGSVFLTKNQNGKTVSLKTQGNINLNVGDQVIMQMFPDQFQNTVFHVAQKVGKMDYEGILYLYYLEPMKLLEKS